MIKEPTITTRYERKFENGIVVTNSDLLFCNEHSSSSHAPSNWDKEHPATGKFLWNMTHYPDCELYPAQVDWAHRFYDGDKPTEYEFYSDQPGTNTITVLEYRDLITADPTFLEWAKHSPWIATVLPEFCGTVAMEFWSHGDIDFGRIVIDGIDTATAQPFRLISKHEFL